MVVVAFKALFIAHAPDAEADKHRCVIETPRYYKLFVAVVRDQQEALEVCRRAVAEEGIDAVILCPGFTHKDVAEILQAVGEGVGVFVARGDGPSHNASREARRREGLIRGG